MSKSNALNMVLCKHSIDTCVYTVTNGGSACLRKGKKTTVGYSGQMSGNIMFNYTLKVTCEKITAMHLSMRAKDIQNICDVSHGSSARTYARDHR